MTRGLLTAEELGKVLTNAEPGSQVDLVKQRWDGFRHIVKEGHVWRLEGFISFFQNIYELIRAADPSLEPTMPPQCFDADSIAHMFRIPVEELAPWRFDQEPEFCGFSEQDQTNLSVVKKLLEKHVVLDKTESLADIITAGHATILEHVASISIAVEDVREEFNQKRIVKEWYSPAEVAELLGKAPFTVREWCRLGRVNVRKRPTGRGDAKEWEISREEVERIRNHGLLPIPKY